MFWHYLKIALRNIRKYALQNTVSIIGLAAGFIALSLSSLWVNYENSYDTFHKDYDRIWSTYYKESGSGFRGLVAKRDFSTEGKISSNVYYQFLEHPEEWPELEEVTIYDYKRESDGNPSELHVDEYARSLFADENPIGKEVDGQTIGLVFRKWKHSCLAFDKLSYFPFKRVIDQNTSAFFSMFLKVSPGTDSRYLIQKTNFDRAEQYLPNIHFFDISQGHNILDYDLSKLNIRNLKTLRMASILLVLCAVTNWLLLCLTVAHRVLTTARENPYEVIKNE